MSGDFIAHVLAHVRLAAAALALALLLGIPLAAFASPRRGARDVLLAIAGALRTVPSLAVLALAFPLLGLGFAPAVLALVLLALPPIVVGVDLGLRGVPLAALDAARGLGMTARQTARRVAWPLALPVVAAGVRTAAVEVVASATLAAFVGGGGLGDEIVEGLSTADYGQLARGAIAVAILALATDLTLGTIERALRGRTAG